MDRPVNKDRQCCYNCNNCIAYFGAHDGGVICDANNRIVYNMLQPRLNCLHFSKGEYQSKSLDKAPEYTRHMIVRNAFPLNKL